MEPGDIMNKFVVFPCVNHEGSENYNGHVVSMANTTNVHFMLFFPIAEAYANLINFLLKDDKNTNANFQILSVYQTMLDSWKAGDRYLSGIIMDMKYDESLEDDIISPTLVICDAMGNLDAILDVNFVHAVMLAAMERKEIIVTEALLSQLVPNDEDDEDDEDEEDDDDNPFPVDKQILDIAKSIISGKNDVEDGEKNKINENKPVNPPKPKRPRKPKEPKEPKPDTK